MFVKETSSLLLLQSLVLTICTKLHPRPDERLQEENSQIKVQLPEGTYTRVFLTEEVGFSCFFEVSVVYRARKFQLRIEAFSAVTVQRRDRAVKILENYRNVETAISWRHTFSVQPAAKTSTNRLARILSRNRACVINANLDTKQV